jgi:glycosyltransferase involved in cell wall biosynthesis
MPTFTAIVPNYNDGAQIGAALASLFGQTHAFDQVLIVDDGSTDDSIARIAALTEGRANVRLIRHEKNQGVVAALNTGINACDADFLLLCSANDTYAPRLVEWCAAGIAQHPDAGMISGNALLSYTESVETGQGPQTRQVKSIPRVLSFPGGGFYPPEQVVAHQRRAPIHFNGGASMLRTALVRQYGGLLPQMKWHCDWFMYNLIAFGHGVVYVPEIFSIIGVDGKPNYSSNINIWDHQKPVLESMFRTLKESYPRHAQYFRRAALLPAFHLGNPLLLCDKDFRWLVTPLLLWRVMMHKLFYWLKYFLPRPFMMRVRAFIGV